MAGHTQGLIKAPKMVSKLARPILVLTILATGALAFNNRHLFVYEGYEERRQDGQQRATKFQQTIKESLDKKQN